MKRSGFFGVLASLTIATGCARENPAGSLQASGPADRLAYNPVIDPAEFTAVIDNPYLPLRPGTTFLYSGQTADGIETGEVTVTHKKKQIIGVTTVVVHDRVFLNGSLIEDTFDWYAQDKKGDVWYFGEDAKQYANGSLVGTAGSWEAGRNGAKPGIVMKAEPRVGDTYRQEFAPGVAEDMAKVLGLNESVSVPYGSFDNCLSTMEWTPLEPGVREHKYYCPGIGLVLVISPEGGREREELTDLIQP